MSDDTAGHTDSPPIDPAYLQAIFDRSADGLMICDSQGNILNLNRTAERLNGVAASEVIGRNVGDLVREGRIDRSATQEVLETRRQVSVIQNTAHSGHTLLVTGTPVFDENGDIAFVVVNERDISLIESMRRELAQVRQESERVKHELTELNLLELRENRIVAESVSMKQTLKLALKLATLDVSNILIQGESGTGKGLCVKFIHKHSPRAKKPFVQINCAALPETLLEAELFGYEPGAFTGARKTGKVGLLEVASGGTVLLDEIGEMPLSLQAKLLTCLDERTLLRIGGIAARKIDCAILAATNQHLDDLTRKGRFRLDLFHRLNTFTLTIPPLRERPEDILELVRLHLKQCNQRYSRRTRIGYKAFELLQAHAFPGNVRELINIIKKAVVMSDTALLDDFITSTLTASACRTPFAPADSKPATLTQALSRVECELLEKAARTCRTTRQAAQSLGISQPTLVRKFKKYGIAISKIPGRAVPG